MNKNNLLFSIFFSVVFLSSVVTLFPAYRAEPFIDPLQPSGTFHPKTLLPISPILIYSDDDLGPMGYNFNGSGTEADPYRIENYLIEHTGGNGIYIKNTTAHFIIQNCEINYHTTAIYINSIARGTGVIANNTITNCLNGIYFYNSEEISIIENEFEGNEDGINVGYYSPDAIILSNTFTTSGIDIDSPFTSEEIETLTIQDNSINGKPIEWMENLSGAVISGDTYGQLYLFKCENTLITHVNISTNPLPSYWNTLFLFYCTNMTVQDSICAPKILGGEYNTIINNEVKGAISLDNANHALVKGNKGENELPYRIFIRDCQYIQVEDNICGGRGVGIYLEDCTHCELYNNTITDTDSDSGIKVVSESQHILISHNTINNSHADGIVLYLNSYTVVCYNKIINSNKFGIHIWEGTENNQIYGNLFINNGGSLTEDSQGHDDGINNDWYNTSNNIGNYWDDWSGTGVYSINGSAAKTDPYPLILDDGDSMPLLWEVEYGLNPWINDDFADKDDDGLTNGAEYIHMTNPNNPDTDTDGLEDGEEVYSYNTDPLDADTDNDTMSDGWEVTYGLDPLIDDSEEDLDEDNLNNGEEAAYGTDPTNQDTDGDGLFDGDEVHTVGTKPTDEDTDKDGLLDGEEVSEYETDPLKKDTDEDGLEDGEEINIYHTNPNNSDTDGDGHSDGEEVEAGTDPLDSEDPDNPDNPEDPDNPDNPEDPNNTDTVKINAPNVLIIMGFITGLAVVSVRKHR